MKIDFNLEPKDYIKILIYLGAGGLMASAKPSQERMAVLETKVERVQVDVSEIKALLIRRAH